MAENGSARLRHGMNVNIMDTKSLITRRRAPFHAHTKKVLRTTKQNRDKRDTRTNHVHRLTRITNIQNTNEASTIIKNT